MEEAQLSPVLLCHCRSWTRSRWSHMYREPGAEKPISQLSCWER